MAGKKLYELDPHSSIVDTDVVAISATDSGDAEKSTAAEIKTYVKSGLSTDDVSASTDKNYVTDAQATVIGNTSGTNSGDETESSIKTKLGVSTLSGSNTGDEDATSIKTKLGVSTLSGSNTGDQDLSGLASKTNVLELDNTDAFTPTADYHPATKKYVDDNSGGGTGNVTASGTLTDNAILLGGGTTVAKTSSKIIVTTLGADNTTVPTSGAVAAAISGSGGGDVSGPASSTDSNVAMFNGTTGKLLKDSGVSLSGTNTGDQSASDFNHDDLSNITGTVGEYNHPTDAQMVVLGNTSNTNTGDEVVATGADVDTGTNNTKMVTPKAIADSKLSYTDGTETLTNKRINQRVISAASYTTDTGTSLNIANCDLFIVTAQAGDLKLNNPGGTPLNGQKLMIRIKDNGTAIALTYDTQFRAIGVTLPTTTVISKTLYIGLVYNSDDTKRDILAVGQEA